MWLDLLQIYILALSSTVNPIILFITNNSFNMWVKRDFKSRYKMMIVRCLCCF